MTPPLVLLAVCSSLVAMWWTSALVLQGGGTTLTAVMLALALGLATPVGLAMWKQGSARVPLRRWAAVHTIWSLATATLVAVAVPDPLALSLREHGWMLAARSVGEDHGGTRAASMLSHEVAETLDRSEQTVVVIPTASNRITVDVTLGGPDGEVERRYLWDTGATYTTLTRQTARKLGIDVPANAPRVKLDTAAGPREATLVVLPELRIGEQTVEKVAASICDDCAHDEIGGLLGLNVMRHLVAELSDAATLRLTPQPKTDRTPDIANFVALEVIGSPTLVPSRRGQHLHWRIRVSNHGSLPLRSLAPAVVFEGGETLRGEEVPALAAGATAVSRVKGPVDKGTGVAFRLRLHHAAW